MHGFYITDYMETDRSSSGDAQSPSIMRGGRLLLDAYDGGNLACLINDYRCNPFGEPQQQQQHHHHHQEKECLAEAEAQASVCSNVRFVQVCYYGWPYLFVVAGGDGNGGGERDTTAAPALQVCM